MAVAEAEVPQHLAQFFVLIRSGLLRTEAVGAETIAVGVGVDPVSFVIFLSCTWQERLFVGAVFGGVHVTVFPCRHSIW